MEDKSEKCDTLNSFSIQVKFSVSCVSVCAQMFFRLNFGPVFWFTYSVSLARIEAVGATASMRKHQY